MAILRLGTLNLWDPPRIAYELTGVKPNYTSSACGQTLESTDLVYKLYLSHLCTLAETQELQAEIEDLLTQAPNLILVRQETPDALVFRNQVQSGKLEPSTDLTEIRARYTRNRTLAFTLTIRILPSEGITGAFLFPHARALAAQGSFDWAGDNIDGLLYTESSTAPNELNVQTLTGFVGLSEVASSGYAREDITGRSVDEGAMLELILDDPEFGPMDDPPEPITGMILFQNNGSDATNVPLILVTFEPFLPGGGSHTISVNLTGLF